MKAAVIESPGVLKIWDIPQPVPGEYDVLCENLYGATCTGTDTHLIRNTFPWGCNYPAILGHESIGRVVECGSKVRNFRVGDMVTRVGAPANPSIGLSVSWGGFAEYGIARDHWAMRADGQYRSLWDSCRPNQIVPPNFDPGDATMIITWRETLSYVSRMGIGKGSNVLVLGSGANGLSIANHAANLEAERILLIGSAARKETALRIGATDFVDYKTIAPDTLKASYPDGFDFIIDAVGKKDNLNICLPLLRPGGTVGVYGIDDYNTCSMNPLLPGGTFTFFGGGYDEEESHARVVDLMRTGNLRATDYLGKDSIPLDQIEQAFQSLWDRKHVKMVIQLKHAAVLQ
jgi:threonine dehydrogenase-like Zn-dependent dehydrogenase